MASVDCNRELQPVKVGIYEKLHCLVINLQWETWLSRLPNECLLISTFFSLNTNTIFGALIAPLIIEQLCGRYEVITKETREFSSPEIQVSIKDVQENIRCHKVVFFPGGEREVRTFIERWGFKVRASVCPFPVVSYCVFCPCTFRDESVREEIHSNVPTSARHFYNHTHRV